MSCRHRPRYPTFTSALTRQVGEFEVATGGGVWVATGVITMLKDSNAMLLVQTMISLAHSLGLKVVAEGVDDEEQVMVLRLMKCDEMQGYLFSKPLPREELTKLLQRE